MNTGAGGCSLLIMGALAVILGGRYGFFGIIAAIVVVGAIAFAMGQDSEIE